MHAGLLLLATLICACGDPSSAPSATGQSVAGTMPPPTALLPTAPTDVLPATSMFVMPTRNDVLVDAIEAIHVTEPCPDSPGGPDGAPAMQAELARLEPMLGAVLAYGGQHSDEFGTYGLIWQGTNDASVFISFTTHLDAHRDTLNDLVAYPDELIVCQVALSGDVARALMAKLTDELNGRFSSVAIGGNGVEVVLMPGEEALADQLIEQYGDAVVVSVCADAASCVETML